MLLVSSGWRGEPESVGDDGAGGAQHRGDQRRQMEMALAGGAHDAGEHRWRRWSRRTATTAWRTA